MDQKKEAEKKCPFFEVGAMIGKPRLTGQDCIKERCMMYDEERKDCGLKQK